MVNKARLNQNKYKKKPFYQDWKFIVGAIVFAALVFFGLVLYFGNQSAIQSGVPPKYNKFPKAKLGKIKITKDGGVSKTIIKEGSGASPKEGQRVKVHYTGTFTDGQKFDSSVDRGVPFEFNIGSGVIQGMSIGVATMKVGEKSKFTFKPEYAYGERGAGSGAIPPYTPLYFEIELLEIL